MDTVLQAQFDRVEAALSSLVDSIATFNPSPQAALDLVAADDELSNGLDQLSTHQANHTRILTLRASASALETQLQTSIRTLASLRADLLSTPASAAPENARPVPANEALAYAMHISPYTVPPTYREPVPKNPADLEKDRDKEDATSSAVPTNGLNTPAAGPSSAPLTLVTATDVNAAKDKDAAAAEPAPLDAAANAPPVTAEQAEWLQKLREQGMGWLPWPDDNRIRSGNLMGIQYLLEAKKDPWVESAIGTAPVPTSAQEQGGEEARMDDGEGDRERAYAVQPTDARKQSMPERPREPEKPREQFTGFDFEDDDDD